MLGLIFFAAFATGLEWWQPDPTLATQNILPFDGWTPKPTPFPEMAKRQQIPAQDTICGYISGDPAGAIDCSGSPCGYNTLYSWFGCCSSASFSGTEVVPLGCPVATYCVPYTLLGECIGACASNTMIMKCTNPASPYCGYGDLVEVPGMTIVGCAPTPFTVPVDLSTELVTTPIFSTTPVFSATPIFSTTPTFSSPVPTVLTPPSPTTASIPSPIHVGTASRKKLTWVAEFFTSLIIILNYV